MYHHAVQIITKNDQTASNKHNGMIFWNAKMFFLIITFCICSTINIDWSEDFYIYLLMTMEINENVTDVIMGVITLLHYYF